MQLSHTWIITMASLQLQPLEEKGCMCWTRVKPKLRKIGGLGKVLSRGNEKGG